MYIFRCKNSIFSIIYWMEKRKFAFHQLHLSIAVVFCIVEISIINEKEGVSQAKCFDF